ncbi:MAG: 30S ribosomal protein S8 [Puniceicoccales bacterium]
MAVHDTIGDFLTTLRNASAAGKDTCTVRYSKLRAGIAQILLRDGYISDVREVEEIKGQRNLEITLKYVDDAAAIVGIERFSTPGRRLYAKYTEIPRVLGGLGTSILTTSKGILSDRDARREKVGGEVICKVW